MEFSEQIIYGASYQCNALGFGDNKNYYGNSINYTHTNADKIEISNVVGNITRVNSGSSGNVFESYIC